MSDQTQQFAQPDTSDWSLGAQGDYDKALLPPGNYVLELTGKSQDEPVKPEYDPEGKKRRARFTFVVVEDANGHEDEAGNPVNYVGETFSQFFTISLHEKSKLLPVVTALMGGRLARDQRVGADLIGRKFNATITHGTSESTGKKFATISAALPVRPRRAAA